MRSAAILILVLALAPLTSAADLQIYFVDVEGGQSTLIVSPSGESMLVDAGWAGNGGRDASRIAEAARLAGIKRIDYLLVTHYHRDHVGGVPAVAEKLPVGTFLDHGPNSETGESARSLSAAYDAVTAKAKHIIVKPGDRIPVKGLNIVVVSADGKTISSPLPGAGAANAACAATGPGEVDSTENSHSAGFVLSYGKFRFADLGDLMWKKELQLACPKALLGTIDAFLITHHASDGSNCPALVHSLHPRVAIANNGATKGGAVSSWTSVRTSPGLEDVWQLHYAVAAGKENNSPDRFIANPEAEGCQGRWIKLTASADGSFTVTNSRNNFSRTYKK